MSLDQGNSPSERHFEDVRVGETASSSSATALDGELKVRVMT